jgi:hypothetical protein
MTPLQKLKTAMATTGAELEAKRERIAEIVAEMDTLDGASVDRAEIERRIEAAMARGPSHSWPGLTTPREDGWIGAFNSFAARDPFGMLASIAPDALRAKLLSAIPDSGISAAERGAKRDALAAELEDAEVAEEVLCRAIESVGGASVPRRGDANPAIVLAHDHELET